MLDFTFYQKLCGENNPVRQKEDLFILRTIRFHASACLCPVTRGLHSVRRDVALSAVWYVLAGSLLAYRRIARYVTVSLSR